MKFSARLPYELVFWIVALLLLGSAGTDTAPGVNHFTLCPLANMGFSWCPGCGIGHAITQLLHGNLTGSFRYHWFGLPALLIIFYRIYSLMKQELNKRFREKEESYV
jgi:hypothetical protein